MKKILMLATAAFLVSGVSFAQDAKKVSKDKKASCKKSGGCCKDKGKTAKL
jgi:hypothetical protein